MPTYDYECKKCGHTFDKFQTMMAARLIWCPKCDGVLERLIGVGGGFLLKGDGWTGKFYKGRK